MSNSGTAEANSATSAIFTRGIWTALVINFFWINASEIWRYLYVVRPMLLDALPGQKGVALFNLPMFGLWSIWDTWLIATATGFYWFFQRCFGRSFGQAVNAATLFTITIFGLIWFGVANMGLLSYNFVWVAVPLAWLEQVVAALIVFWVMNRDNHSHAS